MNPLLFSLPKDFSGKTRRNQVLGEMHNLDGQETLPYRCFVLDHGHFFAESISITDSSGYTLGEGDYQCTGLNKDATLKTGREICSVVVIANPRVTNVLYVDAQMVGGEYTNLAPAIAEMAQGLLNNTRSVLWRNVTDKPNRYTPNGHLHALWDLYGFEGWVEQLGRITQAILTRSVTRFEELEAAFDNQSIGYSGGLTAAQNRLTSHIADTNNPHRLTKAQLGLDAVFNGMVALESEARAGGDGINYRYTTPLRTAQHIESNYTQYLEAHKNISGIGAHWETAALLGTLYYSDYNAILAQCLGVGQASAESAALQGVDFNTLYANSRANLDTGNVVSGRFSPSQLGTGTPDANKILLGNGVWTSINDLFSTYQVEGTKVLYMSTLFGSPTEAVNTIAATFTDWAAYPLGTIVIFKYQYTKTMGTSNGSITNNTVAFEAAVRLPDTWGY